MNERIQKLAEQANLQLIIDDDLTLRKFADKLGELIIEECAKLFDSDEQSERGYRIGDRIYKHFGEK